MVLLAFRLLSEFKHSTVVLCMKFFFTWQNLKSCTGHWEAILWLNQRGELGKIAPLALVGKKL